MNMRSDLPFSEVIPATLPCSRLRAETGDRGLRQAMVCLADRLRVSEAAIKGRNRTMKTMRAELSSYVFLLFVSIASGMSTHLATAAEKDNGEIAGETNYQQQRDRCATIPIHKQELAVVGHVRATLRRIRSDTQLIT